MRALVCLMLVCVGLSSVGLAQYPATAEHTGAAWFVDVAASAGITVRNVNGDAASKRYIIEATGSGVGIIDYDRDGWPDIFLVNGRLLPVGAGKGVREPEPTSHLFRNNHDGSFTDVTAKAGLTGSGWGQGVCVGDYDNDGADDMYVTQYGKNRLYHNERNGSFKEVAVQLGGLDAVLREWRGMLVQRGRGQNAHQLARFGTALIAQQSAALFVERAAAMAEADVRDADEVVAYVGLARLAVEAACLEAMRLAQRSIGLAAFMRPAPIERICRDLATYLRQPAPDDTLTEAAAHYMAHDLP